MGEKEPARNASDAWGAAVGLGQIARPCASIGALGGARMDQSPTFTTSAGTPRDRGLGAVHIFTTRPHDATDQMSPIRAVVTPTPAPVTPRMMVRKG